MASLANAWAGRGHRVTVVTLNGDPSFYPLAPGVEHCALGVACPSHSLAERWINNLRRMRGLRRTIHRVDPDVVISFLDATNVVTLLATIGFKVPVIVCEHNDPSQRYCPLAWRILRLLTYPFAEAVTFLTRDALENMRWLVGERGRVMPNPVSVPDGDDEPVATNPVRRIIAMGRLEPVKGFDYLLNAFHQVAKTHPDWVLVILGEGRLRRQLEQQIEQLGLSVRVDLHGRVQDPFRWLRSGDLFVMSSRFEAFPCALCEAMACGLPAISFDCPSGPRAIIRDGIDGVLVFAADTNALAAAMERLMSDASERRRLASRAPEVLQRFSLESVLRRWDELFDFCGAPARGSSATREATSGRGYSVSSTAANRMRAPRCFR